MWELDHKDSWAPKNWCFWTMVLEKTLESPLDCKKSNQSILKEINLNVLWKDWCWSWNSSTWATWCKELTLWKRPWCWEKMKAGGGGDDRGGWDGCMASLTWWTWFWVSSGSWWWTRKPGMLQSWGCKELDMTEQWNWTENHGIQSHFFMTFS